MAYLILGEGLPALGVYGVTELRAVGVGRVRGASN